MHYKFNIQFLTTDFTTFSKKSSNSGPPGKFPVSRRPTFDPFEINTMWSIENGITKIRRKSKKPIKLGNCLPMPNIDLKLNLGPLNRINTFYMSNSERSDECIDFTMMCSVYSINCRNNASISNFGCGFRWISEYPWCITEIKIQNRRYLKILPKYSSANNNYKGT
ncbi:Uncharacterized protein FWK35_00027946 [Aphis craccivora]|uniref:Uncharacterized protein n=1 Tax=Aphis craccivora TaxID=307492 RepID=A0A6G0W3I3_APHCR|nr:Uncharacterized protein FWK35_00027946 [Aphis craccivora]